MEQIETLLQKLGAAPIWQKVVGLIVAIALLVAGYWYILLGDLRQTRDKMMSEQAALTKEKSEYEGRKKEYLAYRQEINQLLDEQRDVLRLLPKNDDIEQFVEAVQQQVELAGLSRQTLIRDPPVPQDLFIRLPVKMSVYGTYHQLLRFFKSMGEIPRIVNIENLKLTPASLKDPSLQDVLKAEFIAVAFQYLDRTTPAAADTKGKGKGKNMKAVAGTGKGAKK